MSQMIEDTCIVLVSDMNYLSYTAFLAFRIQETTSEPQIPIFVLTSGVSDEVFQTIFVKVQARQIPVDNQTLLSASITNQGHVSIATYYKLLIPSLIPNKMKKCLYLDSDILILKSLDSIFEIDLSKPIGAVETNNPHLLSGNADDMERYFNAGVILFDLDKMRQGEYQKKLLTVLNGNPNLRYQEQDILNIVFRDSWQALSRSYNYMAEIELNKIDKGLNFEPILVHLISARKPWANYAHTIFHVRWREEYLKFNPGGLEKIKADSYLYRALIKFGQMRAGGVLKKFLPRRLKDNYIMFHGKTL